MAPQNPQSRPPSTTTRNYGRDNRKAASIAAGVIITVLILVAVAIFLWHRKTRKSKENHQTPGGRRGALTLRGLHGLHGHTQHRSRYRKRRRHYHHTQTSRHELKRLGRHSSSGSAEDGGCCFGASDPPKEPGRIVVAQAVVYPRVPQPTRVAAWRPQTLLHHHIHDVRHHGRAPVPAPAAAPAAQQHPPPPPDREIVLTELVHERRRARSRSRSVRPRRGQSRTPPPREPVQMTYHQGPVNIVQQQGQPAVVQMVPGQQKAIETMPEQQVQELMPEQPPPPPEVPPQAYRRFVAQPPEPVPGAGRIFQGPPPPRVQVPAAEQRPIIVQAPPDTQGQPQRQPPSPPPAPPQPLPARLPGNQVPLHLRAPMPAVLPAAQVPSRLHEGEETPSTPPFSPASSTRPSTPRGPYPYSPATDTWTSPPWTPELAYSQLSIPSHAPSLVSALWHFDDLRSTSPSTLAGTSYPALPHPGNLVDFAARTSDPAPRKRAWGERRGGLLSDSVSTESSAGGERRGRQVRRRGWPVLVPRRQEEVMSDLMVFSREGTVKGEELAAVGEEGKAAVDKEGNVVVGQGGEREGDRMVPNMPEGGRLEDTMPGIAERLERQRDDKAERARGNERAEAVRAADPVANAAVKAAAKEVRKEAVRAADPVAKAPAKEVRKEAAKETERNGVHVAGNRALWPTVESVTDEMDAGRKRR